VVTMSPEAEKALKTTNRLYDRLTGRRPEIDRLKKAFRGDQPLAFASEEWKKAHRARYQGFSDNWCGVVGSAPAERTELFGFDLPDKEEGALLTAEEKLLWRDWEVNEGPAQASQGFLASTIAKRSSVLVWGDDDDEPEMTWEDPSQMLVDYDPARPRVRRAALKAWLEGDVEYATLYLKDTVWKWKRPSSTATVVTDGRTESGLIVPPMSFTAGGTNGWVPRQDADDDSWPIDNPMGVVPVVEYANRPMLGAEPLSDISGTMAMQNAINMLWAYMFVAADYASMPARVVMGQEPPKIPVLDDKGQKVGEKPVDIEALTKGRMLWLTGQSTKIDQYDAAKLDVFTEVITVAIQHISAQSRTPIYLVHGELGNVNGETLTGLDAPLVSKVRESHKFYNSPVRETFALFALVRDMPGLAKACRAGTPSWKNPGLRSDSQISDAALKDRQIGWPFESILAERYGLSQPKIATIMAKVRAEQNDPYLAQLGNKDEAANADAEPAAVGQ
jgi:hypothetical protein